jgi:hypothetical protein
MTRVGELPPLAQTLQEESAPSTIEKVARETFAEITLSFTLAGFCTLFAVPGSVPILFGEATIQCIVNLALRIFKPSRTDWLSPTLFHLGSLHNVQVIGHEAGHVLALHALLKNPQPQVRLIPFFGGSTSFRVKEATALGQWIGKDWIMPLVSAAGPLLSLSLSTLGLLFGLSHLKSYPDTSRCLIVASLVDFLIHTLYAFSALWIDPTNFANDFVALWSVGIHPLVPIFLMVAVPILILKSYWN